MKKLINKINISRIINVFIAIIIIFSGILQIAIQYYSDILIIISTIFAAGYWLIKKE